jgi:hypothetical protein
MVVIGKVKEWVALVDGWQAFGRFSGTDGVTLIVLDDFEVTAYRFTTSSRQGQDRRVRLGRRAREMSRE